MTATAPAPLSVVDSDATARTACIIGAGPAGLAAAKALSDRGIDFDWFEKGSMVGGLWQIDNDNGGVAAYESLHLNSSRPLTQYPDYPMPSHWPDYPNHRLMAQYFDSFADAFGLREKVTFRTEVTRVEPLAGGGWAVTTDDGATRTYHHVLVANGHHSVPKIPDFPGTFTGETMHAHDYRKDSVFTGKRVLVIGVGNSGMDLACDSSRRAEATFLSTRHGVHVIPKYALGKPADQLGNPLMAYIPFEVERRLYEGIIRVAAGKPEDRGMPKPDHRLLSAHVTVSSDLLDRVGHGDIAMKPNVERFDGATVHFVDGTSEEIDLVVFATGYEIRLPFLDHDVFDPRGNVMPLYQRVVPPDLPGLWFIGFIQVIGSGIPLAAHQAQWVGDLITGECTLPDRAAMHRWIDDDARELAKRYVRSTRHTIQVDYWRYLRAIKQERSHGAAAPSGIAARIRSLLPV